MRVERRWRVLGASRVRVQRCSATHHCAGVCSAHCTSSGLPREALSVVLDGAGGRTARASLRMNRTLAPATPLRSERVTAAAGRFFLPMKERGLKKRAECRVEKHFPLTGLSLLTLDGSHFSNFLCFTMSERGTKRLREATLEERDGESAEECKGDEHGGRGESSEDDATDLADARAGDESDESDGGDGLGRDERDGSDSDVSEEEEEALFSACAAGDLTALNQLLESGQSDTSPHSSRTDTNPNCDNMSHLTTCHT